MAAPLVKKLKLNHTMIVPDFLLGSPSQDSGISTIQPEPGFTSNDGFINNLEGEAVGRQNSINWKRWFDLNAPDNSYNTNSNRLKNMFDGNYSTSCRITNGANQGFLQQPVVDHGFDLLIDVGRKFKPRQFTITSQLNTRFTYQLCFMNEVKTGAEGGVGNQTIGQPFNLQLPVTPSPTAINPQVVDDFMFIGGGGGGSASPSTTPGFLWDVNTPTLLNSDGTTESGVIQSRRGLLSSLDVSTMNSQEQQISNALASQGKLQQRRYDNNQFIYLRIFDPVQGGAFIDINQIEVWEEVDLEDYDIEFDDALLGQQGWINPRYAGSKLTSTEINKYVDGDSKTPGKKPVIENKSSAIFITNTIVGGLEDEQFADLKNHSYVSIQKILIINEDDDSIKILDRDGEDFDTFNRFLTSNFRTNSKCSVKLIEEGIANALKLNYHIKMNKGWLLKSFQYKVGCGGLKHVASTQQATTPREKLNGLLTPLHTINPDDLGADQDANTGNNLISSFSDDTLAVGTDRIESGDFLGLNSLGQTASNRQNNSMFLYKRKRTVLDLANSTGMSAANADNANMEGEMNDLFGTPFNSTTNDYDYNGGSDDFTSFNDELEVLAFQFAATIPPLVEDDEEGEITGLQLNENGNPPGEGDVNYSAISTQGPGALSKAIAPDFRSSKIIDNKFTRDFYGNLFGPLDFQSQADSGQFGVIPNTPFGQALNFLTSSSLIYARDNNVEMYCTFLQGDKNFAPEFNDERSIGTFEIDPVGTLSRISYANVRPEGVNFQGGSDTLPKTAELIFKGRRDGRFLPTISTFAYEGQTLYYSRGWYYLTGLEIQILYNNSQTGNFNEPYPVTVQGNNQFANDYPSLFLQANEFILNSNNLFLGGFPLDLNAIDDEGETILSDGSNTLIYPELKFFFYDKNGLPTAEDENYISELQNKAGVYLMAGNNGQNGKIEKIGKGPFQQSILTGGPYGISPINNDIKDLVRLTFNGGENRQNTIGVNNYSGSSAVKGGKTGCEAFSYEISYLDKDHVLILDIDKDKELFDGIGNKGAVLIPEFTTPNVKNNIEFYLNKAGIIETTVTKNPVEPSI